ncbi:OmpA/MotB family protein [Desulfovibrio inopinatus]|uniref:OmpA/MotB family protein n=1 Tax=Desulfovibrio inopinatus TaxID=102109 RepID=UPI000417ECC8|nr:flagellar motor protein MotB [Desulfovibrio inopinatus]
MIENDEFEIDDEKENECGEQWLTTFADISLLLMTFFVLLYSMSSPDVEKFLDSFQSVKKALGASGKQLMTGPTSPTEATLLVEQARLKQQILREQRRTYQDFESYVSRKGIEGIVAAKLDSGKITIKVPSEVLFKRGDAELTPAGQRVLKSLKDYFIKVPDETINIRGFTDDTPLEMGSHYKDNWELSAMRAVNVLRYFVSQGMSPNRLTATGLADLEPLYPNTSEQNRQKNRRVEFVLEKRIGG